uniref:hypothetical protein n=1 Tax=Vibrio vulnificus TaxID=672 RepID=UPI001868064F|nr:hypothetical protein [Vibrio vulnificus]
MTTITIKEVFGSESVESSSLDYVDCLDGLNSILDKVKKLSSSITSIDSGTEKDMLMREIANAIDSGHIISKRLEDMGRE